MYTYIYIYINTELLDGNQGHQEETHRPTHRFRRLFLDLSMGWRLYGVGGNDIPVKTGSILYHEDFMAWKSCWNYWPISREYNSDRLIPLFPVTGGFPSRGNSYDSFNVCISMSAWTSCWIKRRVSGVSRFHDAHLPHCNINNGAGLHRMTPYIRIYTYIHTYISYVYIIRNYTRQYTCNYRYKCILHH